MKVPLVLVLALAACAPVAPDASTRVIPAGAPPAAIEPGFERSAIADNLLMSARDRFGEAAVRRALASPTYLFAKHYPGMLPPPPPGGSYPPFPVAMLMREGLHWMAATPDGFRPILADKGEAIDALLANRSFWAAPDYAPPTCTDAGASLLMLKVPGRPELVRRGSCGPSQPTEQLVFAVLDG